MACHFRESKDRSTTTDSIFPWPPAGETRSSRAASSPTLSPSPTWPPRCWKSPESHLHQQFTGNSFVQQLLSDDSGRIDANRDHTLLGKERHDIGRTDGDLLSVGYPARAIRNDRFLYVRNFKPDRWPGGDPEFGLLNCDSSPTKSFLTNLSMGDDDYRFYEMSFGKRPAEELYDITPRPRLRQQLGQ